MIGYVTLGTNNLARAARFYDAVAAELGLGRMMEFDQFIAWGEPGGRPGIGVTRPFDGYFRDPDGNKLNAFCVTAGGA